MAKRGSKTTALGRDIREHRLKLGWSQKELAKRAKVSSVAMIESGQRKSPHFKIVKAIAEALGVDPNILGKSKTEEPLPEALVEFLASPDGRDVTKEEVAALRSLRARGKRPTKDTYYWGLKTLRSMLPGDES